MTREEAEAVFNEVIDDKDTFFSASLYCSRYGYWSVVAIVADHKDDESELDVPAYVAERRACQQSALDFAAKHGSSLRVENEELVVRIA